MPTYERLDYGSPDGCQMGGTASLIGFYGKVPAVQGAAITGAATTASTTSTPYGYTTSTQADAIVTAVNAIVAKFTALGLTA